MFSLLILSSLASLKSSSHIFYLVRHGSRYDYDNPERWSSLSKLPHIVATDPPLNAYGLSQARYTASFIKNDLDEEGRLDDARVLSSGYLRVLQTAQPLLHLTNRLVNVEPGLMEFGHVHHTIPDCTIRVGQGFPEVNLSYEPLVSLNEVDANTPERVKEEALAYFRRVHKFSKRFDDYVKRSPKGTATVCFSHAASCSIIASMLNCKLADVGKFAPCGIYKLRRHIEDDGGDTGWVLERQGEGENYKFCRYEFFKFFIHQ